MQCPFGGLSLRAKGDDMLRAPSGGSLPRAKGGDMPSPFGGWSLGPKGHDIGKHGCSWVLGNVNLRE